MAYSYDYLDARDPSNAAVKAANASITIFAVGDVAKTPLTLTTLDGQPLANPITVNANGYGPPFMHATIDRVAWAGGGFEGTMTSYEGMKAEAVAARVAADTAAANAATSATNAATSASLVNAPADTTMQGLINNTGSATRGALNATYGRLSDFILSAANFPGWSTGNRVGAIQAAHDSLPADQGGTIFIPGDVPASTVALNIIRPGVTLMGRGGSGQGVSLTWGATRFYAPASDWAIIVGVGGAGSANYGGVTLRDFQIVGNATSPGGVWMKAISNYRTHGFTVTGFTAAGARGVLTESSGSNSQYGAFYDLQITDCTIGWENNGSNGVRWFGGMIDPNHNAGSILAGSTAVKIVSGDTARFFGTVIQFAETCYDFAVGLNPELHGVRCEAFTTAIKNAAPSLRVYGGSFNNSIIGGGGTVLNNLAAATNTFFDPGDVTSVTTFLTDAGSGTQTPQRRLASATYNPGTAVLYSTSSSTSSDVDAANAAVTFRAPASGRVVVDVQTVANLASGGGYYLSIREGAADVVRKRMGLWGASGAQVGANAKFEISGLAPGSTHTYKLGFASISGTPQLQAGGDWGPLTMTVSG